MTSPNYISDGGSVQLYRGDCLELMAGMPDNSVDLIATDPPYFKVKNEAWDRQWDNPAKFLEWIGALCKQWRRLLKPNGSLYVFASPKMAARVECKIGEWFNICNRITWRKPPFSTKAEMFVKEDLRMFFPASEAIIFAEHCGADNMAKGEAGYAAKRDELRLYLRSEWERAGLKPDDANEACGTANMAGRHYFCRSQWCLPTAGHYESLQKFANAKCNGSGPEYLRREYEDLRRPFTVSAAVPYTDVWDFATVQGYPGKHPCEKPLDMMSHIISASSRPGAVVLDCFAGSGATLEAAVLLGREAIGIEKSAEYFRQLMARAAEAANQLPLFAEATP